MIVENLIRNSSVLSMPDIRLGLTQKVEQNKALIQNIKGPEKAGETVRS